MKIRTNKKMVVQKYLVEYMFGHINKTLAWFDNEEEMNDFVDWLTDTKGKFESGNELTYCKKYEVKEIKD